MMIFNILADNVPDELQRSRYAVNYDKGEVVFTWNDLKTLHRRGAVTHLAGGEAGGASMWEPITQPKEGGLIWRDGSGVMWIIP